MRVLKRSGYFNRNYLLLGASVIILSACIPEDEVSLSDNQEVLVRSQISHYARSFETYSQRSLNALVNDTSWQASASTYPEGKLLDGLVDNGHSEVFVSSALCRVNSTPYHITWFDKTNADGQVSLKGMGASQSGLINARIRQNVSKDHFASSVGLNQIKLNDSAETVLTLTGGCSTLNIPSNSAVMAISIAEPPLMVGSTTKTVLRNVQCPVGEEGSITQRVNATITPEGQYVVAPRTFNSEADLLASNAVSWTEVSRDCKNLVIANSYQVDDGMNVDLIDSGSTILNGSEQANIVATELVDIACSGFRSVDDDESNNDQSNQDDVIEYDTCGTTTSINVITPADVKELTTLRVVEIITDLQCPNNLKGSKGGSVTVSNNGNFRGVSGALNGRTGSLNGGTVVGETSIRKTTKTWIKTTYDSENQPTETQYETIELRGEDLECSIKPQTLSFSCSQIFPGLTLSGGANKGLTFRRNVFYSGWKNPEGMIAADPDKRSWSRYGGALSCEFQETKEKTEDCPAGQEGSGITIKERRLWTASRPGQSPSWGPWTETSRNDDCKTPQSSGGGGGEGVSYQGADGGFYGSEREANTYGGGYTGYQGDNSQRDSGGGGGGGGGNCVLCTYFTFERGWVSKRDYVANSRYGQERVLQKTLNGYHYWAIPLVKYLRKHKGSLKEKVIFKVLVEGWIKQNAFTMGYRKQGDIRGKILMITVKPVCTLIGHFVEKTFNKSLWKDINISV